MTALILLAGGYGDLARSLRGTDDAMRLVEARRLLDGAGWFDMAEPRVGLAGGYLTHWSRLIDAPLAGLMALFGLIVDMATAETVARALWPLLLLPPIVAAQAGLAATLGGRKAGLIAAILGAMCVPGLVQFMPGVVDHHNVQMLLASLAALFGARAVSRGGRDRDATLAGLCLALGLGVGVEALPILAAIAGAIGLSMVIDPARARAVGTFGAALAAGAAATFLATVPQARWLEPACDALAINLLALLVVGGAGAAIASGLAGGLGRWGRFAALATAGGAALSAWIVAGPTCAGGLGFVDPALRPIWLDHVLEMRSGVDLLRQDAKFAALLFGFPLIGLAALAFERRRAADAGRLVLAAAFLASLILAALVIRATGYANWFAVPVVALALSRLRAPEGVRAPLFRAATVAAVNPLTIAFGALVIAPDATRMPEPDARPAPRRCYEAQALASSLGALPRGLVLAHIDLGPHILAHTAHRVIVAPYHRLRDEMVFAQSVFAAAPDAAETALQAARVDYVVDCAGLKNPFVDRIVDRPTLRAALLRGQPPAFLIEETPAAAGAERSPVRVWRLAPPAP